jgi:hypothetical protein
MDIILTEEQKQKVLDKWNATPSDPPSLLELINAAFPDEDVDGRSKEGKAVKEFLSTREIKARGAHEYQAKEKIKLTEEQEEYITNNAGTMKANELSRIIFKNNELTPLSQETRTVNEFLKTIDTTTYQDTGEIPVNSYKPPKTFDKTIFKINKYIHDKIDKNKLTPKRKRDIHAVTGYLETYRFIHQMNTYDGETDRGLFESSFVRYTNDKCDLTQEEVDQYIVLSTEVVIASSIQRRIGRLSELLDVTADDNDGRRMSMSLVDAIGNSQTEYNQCVNRQQKLLESLKEKRSDKLRKQIQDNASILNLVEMWKDEESRKKLIKLADMRRQVLEKEVDSLTSMDELKAKILGLSREEVIDG